MTIFARQSYEITTESRRNISIDMSGFLDDGELLIGSPDIQGSEDLTITNRQASAADMDINGVTVEAGRAALFTVECIVPARYEIEVVCSTDAGQVIEGGIRLRVKQSLI